MRKQNKVAIFNIMSTILLKGISLFTAPIFSRLLGTNGYGVVSIYTLWMGVTAVAFTLQTSSTLVNARVEYPPEQQEKYQSSVMTLSLLAFSASISSTANSPMSTKQTRICMCRSVSLWSPWRCP